MKSWMLAVLSLSILLPACGDDEVTCSPTGTWQISDTRTVSSGGYCDGFDFGTNISTVQVTYDESANTFTWTEDGDSFTGSIDRSTCKGTVTATKQVGFTDDDDVEQVLTMVASRTFTFEADFSGTANVSIDATGGLAGLPCTLVYSSTGARQ